MEGPPTARWPRHDTAEDGSPLLAAIRDAGDDSGAHPVDLAGSNMVGRDLRGAELSGRDLSGVDFSDADLSEARLVGANLSSAVLCNARLVGAELTGADLTDAVLDGCDATQAGFGNATLDRASFFTARVEDASFVGASAASADFRRVSARRARFRGAELTGADFSRSEMHEVDLVDTRVAGACFDEADMQRGRVRGMEGFEQARFVAADVRDVDFSHAYLLRRFIMDQSYLEEFRKRSRFNAVLYWVWWVSSDCGRSVVRWGLCLMALAFAFGFSYRFVTIDYGDAETWLSPYYFSVVTITTLGYGDVLPASAAAQALVMLEVVVGYLLLGGLISIFANKMARRAE